ncbi:MAG: hypothetical protein GPJ51_02460 [Candidatus Heimdallarchaeota archaeon]|nr:hypothetical protein [Candidatus Heimdallarchaeota archaeon]
MGSIIRDLETNELVKSEDFVNRNGIVVVYFSSSKVTVHPRIRPVLSRLIKIWKNRGVSIGICDLGFGPSGVKVGDQEIHFYYLPLILFYHSGELKYSYGGINRDEDFEEIFVKIFREIDT